MRALITGINGFVGGHLAEHLLSSGLWEVAGIARQPALALETLTGRVTYVAADLSDREQTLRALASIRPDVIFHLAGQSNVPHAFADPHTTVQMNIGAQLNLFLSVLQLRIDPLIIVASSNEIYGLVRPEDLPVNEQTPLRPVNPYAVSKAAQDLFAYQYHISHRMRTVRLRPFNHIGPRQTEAFVVPAFAAQIARIEAGLQPPVLRVGNLAAERDFSDVRDIVRAYELAALHGEVGAAYNVGSGQAVGVQRILDILLTFSTHDIQIEPDPSRMRPSDVPRVVCDASRFHADTGWTPRIPLEQTLFDTLEYWRFRVQEQL
ncbi:GDP-mannose 4,6-dehydratase [Roseiflexus sp. RS-1]|jgi:GDP-4-dehydro-6-deoxy-D-mannose reductase|uniref:GDP-mannose 4,6-dehydratase n=1 Tax=Roseiflexus sp. (strain RS-1) TaxID=357808 RepID=UPI0000D7F878|nr:GDP-mannose 4,6-dehydratase [Roseiflexus sp. RS-1]ABQ90242.1 NAD-dependent epimerase/dehydratase [Roseiflexus sp. RS-1]